MYFLVKQSAINANLFHGYILVTHSTNSARMTEEINLSSDQNIEYYIVTLFEKIEVLRRDNVKPSLCPTRSPIRVEIRTLEFWRSVISECLGSFIYVFIVCGAAAGAGIGASMSSVLLATALAAGFAMTSLVQCFGHISGNLY